MSVFFNLVADVFLISGSFTAQTVEEPQKSPDEGIAALPRVSGGTAEIPDTAFRVCPSRKKWFRTTALQSPFAAYLSTALFQYSFD